MAVMQMLTRPAIWQFFWQGMLGMDREVSDQEWLLAEYSAPVSTLPALAARAEKYGCLETAMRAWERHADATGNSSSAEKAAWLRSLNWADRGVQPNIVYIILTASCAQIEPLWKSGTPKGLRNDADLQHRDDEGLMGLPRRLAESDADLFARAEQVVAEYNSKIASLIQKFG